MATDDDAAHNVTPIRALGDEAALAWIRAQPGGRTSLSAAELGRRWGWPRYRVSRRLQRWSKDGLVTQRGSTLVAADIQSSKAATNGLQQVATNGLQHIDDTPEPALQSGRSVAVRNAARDAATVAVAESSYVARLVALDGTYVQALDVDARVPAHRHGRGIRFVTLTAALALATVSGGFSIYGMTAVFVGATLPVIGMGVALELGKLSAVAALPTLRGGALKTALGILVVLLMALNAIGAYGFLAKAHIGHQVEGDVAVAGRSADVEARLAVQAEKVADLAKQIADLDAARTIETPSTDNLRTASAINAQAAALAAATKLRAADDERRQAKRASLADKLTVEAKALADLKIEKARVDGDRRVAEADLGPVRYLATLLGAGDQDVLRWFILVVSLLLDPAAVLLLLAATRR